MWIGSLKVHFLLRPVNGWSARHASIKSAAMNLLIEVCDRRGISRGWGEGCLCPDGHSAPPGRCLERLSALVGNDNFPWHMTASTQIRQYVAALPESRADNPLICAIEMALLDALGRAQQKPLPAYFPIHHGAGTVRYGATVALDDERRIGDVCRRIRRMGIRHLRVQMNDDVAANIKRMAAIVDAFGGTCEVRIDPACSWTGDLSMRHLPMIRHAPVRVVEEPMPLAETRFAEFAGELASMGVALMVCRSGATLADIRQLIESTPYRLVDIKLSKNGGFYRTLKIIDMLRARRIGYQIGAHHGNTGLLWAAERTLNLLCGDAKYRDGSQDALRPKKTLAAMKTADGPDGEAGPLCGAGLGVRVNRRRLDRLRRGPAILLTAPADTPRRVTSTATGTAAARISRPCAESRPAPEKTPPRPARRSENALAAGFPGSLQPFPG